MMLKRAAAFFAFVLAALPATARSLLKNETTGSQQSVLQPGESGMTVKTIAPSQFEMTGNGPGKVAHGMNLFTGQSSFSIPLGGISVRGVEYPIVMSYDGSTKSVMDNDNEKSPTSWVGLGFNLTTPYVAVNHKGTYASFDDVIYCNLGPYGGGQILIDSARSRYYVSTNPYIKIAFDTATAGDSASQFTRWTFTFPDGKKMVFGQDSIAQRFVLYNKGLIKASPYPYVSTHKYIYRWDLRTFYDTIPNHSPRNVLTFEYDQYLDTACSASKKYVREAYIKNIKWMEGSTEVQRYEFKTTPKGSKEYVAYGANELRDDMKLYETRRLDTLKCYKEGSLTHFYKFDWSVRPKGVMDSVGMLSKIRVFYPKPLATNVFVQDSGWTFSYDASRFNTLTSVTYPSSRTDTYTYHTPFYFGGTTGDQDATDYTMKRADGTTEIALPSDTAKLSKWSAESNCDERFCFAIVRDGDSDSLTGEFGIKQKLYLEVKRNAGNYFDPRATDNGDIVTLRLEMGDDSTTADQWKVIPSGNYFLVVGERKGNVKLFEYDGIKWEDKTDSAFSGDSHWSGGKFGGPIKAFASTNYFVIQKTNLPSKLIVAFRNATKWTTLNRSGCTLADSSNYGETIRAGAPGECLEWTRSSLTISPNPNFFTVLDSVTGVFCAYALRKDGTGFEEISKKFGVISLDATLQKSGYPMNWEKQVVSVTPAGDYFLIQSKDGTGVNLYGMYFDGDSLLGAVAGYARTGSGTMQVFPSQDYFVVADPSYNTSIKFFQKSLSSGIPSFSNISDIRTDCNPAYPVLIRTHPNAFTIEYYNDSASYGLRPRVSSGTTYSFLYQVSRLYSKGYAERTSNEGMGYNYPLFNVSFSPSENMLVGTYFHGQYSGCPAFPSGPCYIKYYTARFHPNDTTNFINAAGRDTTVIAYNSNWNALKQSQDVMSQGARMGMRLILDSTGSSRKVRYRLYQFDGKGFGAPDSQFVVNDVVSSSSLSSADKDNVTYQLDYAPSGIGWSAVGQLEFNSHLLSPQFEFADVTRVLNTDGRTTGTVRTFFNLDHYSNNLTGKSMFLIGSEKYSRTMASNYDTTLYMKTISDPYRNPSWPKALYVTHLSTSYSQVAARNQSHMTDSTYYFNYCDTNGAPRFALQNNRPEKILLSQTIFDSLGFTKQAMTYTLSSQPNTDSLKTWSATSPYSTSNVTGASKAVFDGYYFQQDSLWRDMDPSFTNTDLKNGTVPSYSLSRGWLPGSMVTQRDTTNFFQTLESKGVKNTLSNALGESYSSAFYEGLRADPVATVQNAKLSDCAVLMAENGNAVLPDTTRLDYRKKWEKPGSAFYSGQSHTGRYSIKVTDNYGPTINLYLKDVKDLGYNFKVSAWIYSDTGTPVIAVERHSYNGSGIDAYYGAPVTGTSSTKKVWQRWEVTLTNSQLMANSLFNGNNDYLRIWVGTGAPAGASSRVVYVDDIVCVPTTASFSLATYDKWGQTTSTTNAGHLSTYYDIGFKGNVIGVRDERGRMFTQTAVHKMGEN